LKITKILFVQNCSLVPFGGLYQCPLMSRVAENIEAFFFVYVTKNMNKLFSHFLGEIK